MPNDVIKGMGFGHMAVGATDFDKSMAFYQALGCKLYTQWGEGDDRIALLDIGDGNKLELFAKPAMVHTGEGPFIHLAFSVQNVDEAYRHALSIGATPDTPPKELPLDSHPLRLTLRVAFVKGPDGERLEFCKQVISKF